MPPLLLFCQHPFEPLEPDPDYAAEYEAARAAGLGTALLDSEVLTEDHAPERAVRQVPTDAGRAIYRGWMLRAEQYEALSDALKARGVELRTTPAAYRHTHHFPESYALIEGETPESHWLPAPVDPASSELSAVLERFGDGPLIVKDWVKSRKHEWEEACFIPDASDTGHAVKVISTFIERQGESLVGGIVLRAFERFETIGEHPRSGLPMAQEVRAFILDGEPFCVTPYWGQQMPADAREAVAQLDEVWCRIDSPFFTADVARRDDGVWRIVELGDAQVAGLPDGLEPVDFYRRFAARLKKRSAVS